MYSHENIPNCVPDSSLSFTSPGGLQLPPKLVLYVFSILEVQGACGTLARLQESSRITYKHVNLYLYRHLYLFRSTFDKLFAFFHQEVSRATSWESPAFSALRQLNDPMDDVGQLLSLSPGARMISLFTLVKKITLTFDISEESEIYPFEAYKIVARAMSQFDGRRLFSEVTHFRILGSRTFRWSPGQVLWFFALSCQPKHLCIKWPDETWSLIHVTEDFKSNLTKVVVHNVDRVAIPSTGDLTIDMSYAISNCNHESCASGEGCALTTLAHARSLSDTASLVSQAEHRSSYSILRILSGDGMTKESEHVCRQIVNIARQFLEEDSGNSHFWHKRFASEEKKIAWEKRYVSFLDTVVIVPHKEALAEPPCEVCGGK
ncbi:uncharacterized protein IL334_003251 [Kwoniella shivajii]|uniref:F-box domain-containing protein n=1 Tax=Kwoniella shivajii TaxID=564305 RepID=A0ABZ1D154_9TREE|nr:hypothetical protein IL334_003251 [Kwoniella shivajii]